MKQLIFRAVSVAAASLLFMLGVSACGTGTPAATTAPTTQPGTEPVVPAGATDVSDKVVDGAVYSFEDSEWFCIAAGQFGGTDGAYATSQGYQGDLNQLWRLYKNADGTVRFENLSSGLILTVREIRSGDGDTLNVAEKTSDYGQSWRLLTEDGGKTVKLQNVSSGNYLAPKTVGEGANLVQRTAIADAAGYEMTKRADADVEFPSVLRLSGDYISSASCPEVYKFNGVYYNINMTGGMVIKSSKDLQKWTTVGKVFEVKPSWIKAEIGADGIWCPGYYKVGDTLRVYYAASASGSRNSLIGMVEAKSPTGPFVDGGMVIRSDNSCDYNCIDPCVFTDDDGKVYLLYGSYWTGIYMRRLNAETGLLDESDPTVWHLAQGSGEMEAPYLIKRGEYYYLFVAMGNLSRNNNYHWTVGRSTSLFGPYVDKNGKPMLEGFTSTLTEYKEGIEGVAHAQPFLDDDGTWYMVAESWVDRSDENRKVHLHISKMIWNDAGWPVTALAKDLLREIKGK